MPSAVWKGEPWWQRSSNQGLGRGWRSAWPPVGLFVSLDLVKDDGGPWWLGFATYLMMLLEE